MELDASDIVVEEERVLVFGLKDIDASLFLVFFDVGMVVPKVELEFICNLIQRWRGTIARYRWVPKDNESDCLLGASSHIESKLRVANR